jgi:CHASE2 domain-containing sensor protein
VAGYIGVLVLSFLAAMVSGYTPLGRQIDNDVYDWMFRLHRPAPWDPQSVILGIDEASFKDFGGVRGLRLMLADALERVPLLRRWWWISPWRTRAMKRGRLPGSLGRTRNLVLPRK